MVLSASEESFIKAVRMLPPDESGRRVECSDSWSDEDRRDAALASLERFEQHEWAELWSQAMS
jgi:hypothetical protein